LHVEREVKLRLPCEALGEARRRLEAAGLRVEGEAREVDIYYSHPCRDFLASDEALRLRLSGGRARLTYKGPRRVAAGGVKERVEIEAEVDGRVAAILEALGFREALRITKDRVYLSGGGYLASLDVVHGLGCFVEIEGEDPLGLAEKAGLLALGAEPVEETYVELKLGVKRGSRGKG